MQKRVNAIRDKNSVFSPLMNNFSICYITYPLSAHDSPSVCPQTINADNQKANKR
jgi:hypothetical protein